MPHLPHFDTDQSRSILAVFEEADRLIAEELPRGALDPGSALATLSVFADACGPYNPVLGTLLVPAQTLAAAQAIKSKEKGGQ